MAAAGAIAKGAAIDGGRAIGEVEHRVGGYDDSAARARDLASTQRQPATLHVDGAAIVDEEIDMEIGPVARGTGRLLQDAGVSESGRRSTASLLDTHAVGLEVIGAGVCN